MSRPIPPFTLPRGPELRGSDPFGSPRVPRGDRTPGTAREGRSTSSFSAARWKELARAVGLAPDAPVLVALSGGADSVYLLHVVAASKPRPRILAVHVDHGLRGEESREDAEFCLRLCSALSVPFVRRTIRLDPEGPSLEARARAERYRALCAEARAHGIRTILTGHHADDALETLLMRWMRGTHLHGLAGLRSRLVLHAVPPETGRPANERVDEDQGLDVVRPLIALRREEVRRTLRDHGLAWREDGSNASSSFTRNRIRNTLLPAIEDTCGPEALENLRAFGAAVETLEERCAALTAPLAWAPPVFAAARRGVADADAGGTLPRRALEDLVPPLRRRALWRLLVDGTGRAPSRAVLELVLADLESGRAARHTLPGGWSLRLRGTTLELEPPGGPRAAHGARTDEHADPQLDLPFSGGGARARPAGLRLPVPGAIALPDGRTITAQILEMTPGREVLRSPNDVELDAERLFDGRAVLRVRWVRPGDRFHPLGAPGTRRVTRFLADAGIASEDRARVPLVFAGRELIWVAGIRPSETRRVQPTTRVRLRLSLQNPALALATAPASTRPAATPLFEPDCTRPR